MERYEAELRISRQFEKNAEQRGALACATSHRRKRDHEDGRIETSSLRDLHPCLHRPRAKQDFNSLDASMMLTSLYPEPGA